jgi:excisionase family DNA binding protein
MSGENLDDYLSVREASLALGIGYQTCLRWARSNKLPAIRLCSDERCTYMIPRSVLGDPRVRQLAQASAWRRLRWAVPPPERDRRRRAARSQRDRAAAAALAAQEGGSA